MIVIIIVIDFSISTYHIWSFTTDDAFISWRYAVHLIHGHGLRFNIDGIPVEGYSNFAWVMLSALIMKAGLPIASTLKWMSVVCFIASLKYLYCFSRTFLSPLFSTFPLLLYSHYLGVAVWMVSGLETIFYVALAAFVNWQCALAVGYQSDSADPVYNPKAWIMTSTGLLLLMLTRFDGIIWGLIVLLFMICALCRAKNTLSAHYRHIILVATFCVIIPYAIYFFIRILYFNQLLPNSFLCKQVSISNIFQLDADYLKLIWPLLILSLPYFIGNKDCRQLLIWLPSVIYFILLYQASPAIAYFNRLFLAAFCVFTVAPAIGINTFCSFFSWDASKKAWISTLIALLFAACFIPNGASDELELFNKHYEERNRIRNKIASDLNQQVKPFQRVLIADCGVIPFFAREDIHFIDSLCLNNHMMTNRNYISSQTQYAYRIKNLIKPDWVVDSYYPKLAHGNNLNDELREMGFFKDYQLIKRYASHEFSRNSSKIPVPTNEDFVYRIYQRHVGRK
jgi:hypothetical protein